MAPQPPAAGPFFKVTPPVDIVPYANAWQAVTFPTASANVPWAPPVAFPHGMLLLPTAVACGTTGCIFPEAELLKFVDVSRLKTAKKRSGYAEAVQKEFGPPQRLWKCYNEQFGCRYLLPATRVLSISPRDSRTLRNTQSVRVKDFSTTIPADVVRMYVHQHL